MKSILELELELANAKLAKMTSTVKQLGTKLKKSNEDKLSLGHELSWCKEKNKELEAFRDSIRKVSLVKEEAQLFAKDSSPICKDF